MDDDDSDHGQVVQDRNNPGPLVNELTSWHRFDPKETFFEVVTKD